LLPKEERPRFPLQQRRASELRREEQKSESPLLGQEKQTAAEEKKKIEKALEQPRFFSTYEELPILNILLFPRL
jgi:hypothetical protein